MKLFSTNQPILAAVVLAMAMLAHAPAQAQSAGTPLWTNRYSGPAKWGRAKALGVDRSGNVVVTGTSLGGSGTAFEYTTIKYSGAGVPLWLKRYNGGLGYDSPVALAVDQSNNVVVTGYSMSSDESIKAFATVKYSEAGVTLWVNRYQGPGGSNASPAAVAVDSGGNVVVTGQSVGSGGSAGYATIKYSGAGVPLWTNWYFGPGGFDSPAAQVVDGNDNVIVTGTSTGTDTGSDYLTVKYSSTGVPLWTNRFRQTVFEGVGNDTADAVGVDAGGNVFVTGYSDTYYPGDYYRHTDGRYTTVKYSALGAQLWVNSYFALDWAGSSLLAVDPSGNVVVIGSSSELTTTGSTDVSAITKYSAEGASLWGNGYDLSWLGPAALALDGSGNVFVTGGSGSLMTLAYSSAGALLWTNRYSGPGDLGDGATAVGADSNGNVFVTGDATVGSYVNSYDEYVTIKYSGASGPRLTIGFTSANTVAVSWPSSATGFILQQNTDGMTTSNWSPVTATPADDATTRTVIVNPVAGNVFYRLKSP